MKIYCPENERIKHQYFEWLRDAKRMSELTINKAKLALKKYDIFTQHANFKLFRKADAVEFKRCLRESNARGTDSKLSLSTLDHTLYAVKEFFIWLARQEGYRSRIDRDDLEYFNLSAHERRIAKAPTHRLYPTLHEVLKVLGDMPSETDLNKRDRALIAFSLLTAVRPGALASLRIKHVNLERMEVIQDPREVKTKFRKFITTYFFPVGVLPLDIFSNYFTHVTKNKGYGPDDALFPKSHSGFTTDGIPTSALSREHWANGQHINQIIKKAFQASGITAYTTHCFRHTLGAYGEEVCTTPEEWKAWSLNLGHKNAAITFNSYGNMNVTTQARVFMRLRSKPKNTETAEESGALMKEMHRMLLQLRYEKPGPHADNFGLDTKKVLQ